MAFSKLFDQCDHPADSYDKATRTCTQCGATKVLVALHVDMGDYPFYWEPPDQEVGSTMELNPPPNRGC